VILLLFHLIIKKLRINGEDSKLKIFGGYSIYNLNYTSDEKLPITNITSIFIGNEDNLDDEETSIYLNDEYIEWDFFNKIEIIIESEKVVELDSKNKTIKYIEG